MKQNNKDLKQNAFVSLRNEGFTFDEIRRTLNCSERTLYRWQNELGDNEYEDEKKQVTETTEREQILQSQIDELREHQDNLSRYYSNLWNQVHIRQKYAENEAIRPYQLFFEMQMENDRKRQAILSQQLQRCNEFEMERELKEGRLSKPDVPTDMYFEERIELMARWNKEIDIRSGRNSASTIPSEVPQRNANEVRLLSETVEGRGFEQRIADRCFKRSTKQVLDGL